MSGGLPINLPIVGSGGSAVLKSLGTLGASVTFLFPTSGNVAYDGTLSAAFAPSVVASASTLYGEMVLYIHQPLGSSVAIALPSNVLGLPSNGISIPAGNIARIVLACEAGMVLFVSATNFVAQVAATTVGTFTVGFNWSGMETNGGVLPGVAGTDYGILTDAEMAYYSAKGLLLNRLPILWERIQPTLSSALDTGYLSHITDALTLAAKYNAKFIVDLHNYGYYSGNVIGGGTLTNTQFADVWTRLATALAGHAGLAGYDIMNEPHDLGPSGSSIATQDSIWTAAVQAVVTAINNADPATDIYVEGLDYSDAFLFASNNPTLHTVTSSANRIIYEAHSYLDRDSSGTNFIWANEVAAGDVLTSPVSTLDTNIGVKRINPFISWCLAHSKIGFLGEVGVGRDVSAWNDALRNTMTRAHAAGLGLTYWCGGSGYVSYPEGITPDSAGNDTNQMAVLCEFTGVADAPTRYTVTAAVNRGAVSASSGAFTVLVKGRIATAFTITPATSVSGVTFTPASLSVPVGDNFAGSFVINAPATAAAIKVSFSNTGGLTDPAALGYSTITDLFVGLGAEPTNVWWPTLLYTPYPGSYARLQRSSDSAQLDVGFTSAGMADQSTAATWYGSATPSYVDIYDQGPSARHMVPVFSDNTSGPVVNGSATALATSAADYPTFVPSAYNSLPTARFAKSRMDAHSPMDGSTAITVFLAVKPTSVANANYMMSWAFVQRFVLCGDTSGDWEMSGETTIDASLNVDPTVPHVYAVTWGAGGSRTVWRDGSVFATSAATETSLAFQYRDAVNFGYFRFYPTFAAFDLVGAIVLPVVPTAAQMAAFFNRLCGDLAIPQVGASGAMTVTASTTTTLAVSLASPPANATSITYQYRQNGTTTWTTAGSVAVSGTGAQTYSYTGLAASTAYDLAAFGTSGGYTGPTTTLLKQSTAALPAGTGPAVQYYGVNLSGPESGPTGYFPNTTQINYWTKTVAMNTVRLPTLWEHWTVNLLGSTLDSSYAANVDTAVNAITGNGAVAIIDIHGYGASSATFTTTADTPSGSTTIQAPAAVAANFQAGASISSPVSGSLASGTTVSSVSGATVTLSTATTADIPTGTVITLSGYIGQGITNTAFASFCAAVTARYKSNSLVWFELQNEPGQTNDALWIASQNAAIAAIRQAGFTNKIVYTACHGGNSGAFSNSLTGYSSGMVDSASNLIMSVHQYFDSNQSGTAGSVGSASSGPYFLYRVSAWARRYGVQLLLGEFGAGIDATSSACLTNVVEYLQDNADVWAAWTLWGAGDFGSAPNSYPLGIAPTDSTGAANYSTPTNTSAQILAVAPYVPGGNRRGQASISITYAEHPVPSGTYTFGASILSGFTGATTAATSPGYTNSFSYTDVDGLSFSILMNIPAAPSSTQKLTGCDDALIFSVNANGTLNAVFGNNYSGTKSVTITSSASVCDGNGHWFAASGGPNGLRLLVDGVIVASSTTIFANTGVTNNGGWRYWYSTSVPRSQSDMQVFLADKYTANYTVPSVPATGGEPNTMIYWPGHTDATGYI